MTAPRAALAAVAVLSFVLLPAGARSAGGKSGIRAPAVVIAHPKGASVVVHAQADSTSPSTTFPAAWSLAEVYATLGTSTARHVFPVRGRHGQWTRVLLPDRPDGTTGWIRTIDLTFSRIRYRVEVVLSERHLTARGPHGVIYDGLVAVGSPDIPTPTGTFFLRARVVPPAGVAVYGPHVLVTSAHSRVLDRFEGGDGTIVIQGNNDASVLGQAVTHGDVRMDNAAITKLARTLPLGTPIEIVE